MASVIGSALALILLLLVAAGLWLSWRRPIAGLGALVAGMAFHSFLLMVLLALGTPHAIVRAFQAWKEALLVVLTAGVLLGIWQDRRHGRLGRLTLADRAAIAFAVVAVVYLLVPSSVLHSSANLTQRVLGFRVVALLPLLYLLGRRLVAGDRQLGIAFWLCVGTGAFVAVFGLVELWLVPTRTWLGWGVNLYTSFLGFTYHGPRGLPENFFLTLADGTLVRRMVSIYLSPLPIAYTGLLLFPLGAGLAEAQPARSWRRWLAIGLLALGLVAVLFSATRLAVFVLLPEAVLLAVLLRRRWLVALVPAVAAGVAFVVLAYPSIGPVVDRNLDPGVRGSGQLAISGNDVSTQEHYGYLKEDLKLDLQHPLGLGIGASTNRFGTLAGTGESAVLGMFGDLGAVGGLLYVLLYAAALWNGFRAFLAAPPGSLQAVLPLTAAAGGLALVPITMTSDLWADLSVTFLFWWAAGASAALAARAAVVTESVRRPASTSVRAASPR